MATTITQKPLLPTDPIPVGQPIVFTVSNPDVDNYFNVKFKAEVFVSQTPPDTSLTTDLIGTFKTTPNAQGVGIFDFSAVVENHVKADNISPLCKYKTVLSDTTPIHLIDQLSFNDNAMKYLVIIFSMEGSATATGIPTVIGGGETNSIQYKIFNGYLKYTDNLLIDDNDFSFPTSGFSSAPIQLGGLTSSFLTNAPTTQYANIDDYGTVGWLAPDYLPNFDHITFTYYSSTGGSLVTEDHNTYLFTSSNLHYHLGYMGCYPANLRGWSSTFQALVAAGTIQGGYYTVQAFNASDDAMSQLYTINVNCPELKNYEPIRLAWLNQWGAWDYYTFTKKSTRSLSTQGSTYTQLEGTWNEKTFKLNGYRGGKKAFRVNATEKIKMNTDFVSESESEWFEELINSPEVYLLEGFQTDPTLSMLNTYVTPVRLTTSSYTRKTIANDKLMQYTFEVEKSKTFRTQSV